MYAVLRNKFFAAMMPVVLGMIMCMVVRAGAMLVVMPVVMPVVVSMVFAVIVTARRTVFVPVI